MYLLLERETQISLDSPPPQHSTYLLLGSENKNGWDSPQHFMFLLFGRETKISSGSPLLNI